MASDKFKEALAKREAEKAAREAAEAAAEQESGAVLEDSPDTDLVPDSKKELSEEDREMDQVIDTIKKSGIVNLYNRWNTKGYNCVPRPGQRESIKIRCPWPDHSDEHASAWINSDKDVFHCGTCDKGGDYLDIAAVKFSYPDYKSEGADFHNLRRAMAEDFGYQFQRKAYGTGYNVIEPEPDEEPAPATEPQLAVVTTISEPDDDEDDDKSFYANSREVDAGAFIKEDTFLAEWVKQTYQDAAPNDYSFWHGLLALGLAAGRDVYFKDRQAPVWGNLFLCLLGPSGVGKSRSKRHLVDLLKGTNHIWKDSDDPPRGVKLLGAPRSAEVVVKLFDYEWAPDPTNPKAVYPLTVKGLVEFNEYASLNNIVQRQGNDIGSTLMQLYDAEPYLKAPSLTAGVKPAHEPFGSLLTTTQPRSLRRLITQASLDSGFANRFVFVTGIPKRYQEFDLPEVDISPCFSRYSAIVQWCQTGGPTAVWFDDEARARANDFWLNNLLPLTERGDPLLARLSLTMKKMILLNAINEMETVVTEKMLDRTLSIFDYIVRAYSLSGDRVGETKLGEIERLVIQAVQLHQQKNKTGMTPAEFRKKYHRRKFETADVVRVFENLVKLGELDRFETKNAGKVGAPTVRYKVAGA